MEIFKSFYDNDGYYSNEILSEYNDTVTELDVTYNYRIEYGNSVGSFNTSDYSIDMFNRNPYDIYNFSVSNVTNVSAYLSWDYQLVV